MENLKFCIKDYTLTPGGRFIKDGPFSGEDFKNKHLIPMFLEALKDEKLLYIDLDGTYGYPSSFLEESFGGLVREFGTDNVKKIIRLISVEDPEEIARIHKYINDAGK